MSVDSASTRWTADDLGKPIPDSQHAVSACLPLWAHNIGYEEGDRAVMDLLQAGYPRFCLHPLTQELFHRAEYRYAGDNECCYVFPSERVAERCRAYIRRRAGVASRACQLDDSSLYTVTLPQHVRDFAKEYWQHSGEIVPSRAAHAFLNQQAVEYTECEAKTAVRNRVAQFADCDADDVYLFPSGMAAIHVAWRAIRQLNANPGATGSAQFGFPYVDTLKILERFSDDVAYFFPTGSDEDVRRLTTIAGNGHLKALFCEIPSNPLLVSPNLHRLRELADANSFPLVIDDTLGAIINTNVLPHADILVTSLTKFFSGAGDVLAGSLILNRDRPFYSRLKDIVASEFEDLLLNVDAEILEHNSRDIEQRVQLTNANAEQLCDRLLDHPAVDRVYYPKYVTRADYDAAVRSGAGYGGLFSIDIRDSEQNAPRVFDALRVAKGPNLGTRFSLCCPYTILAHYNELEFAEECGISRYLLRVSIGTEDVDELIRVFDEALAVAE